MNLLQNDHKLDWFQRSQYWIWNRGHLGPKRSSIVRAANALSLYANFKTVPRLRLFRLYRAIESFRVIPARLRDLMAEKIRKRHLPGELRPHE